MMKRCSLIYVVAHTLICRRERALRNACVGLRVNADRAISLRPNLHNSFKATNMLRPATLPWRKARSYIACRYTSMSCRPPYTYMDADVLASHIKKRTEDGAKVAVVDVRGLCCRLFMLGAGLTLSKTTIMKAGTSKAQYTHHRLRSLIESTHC